MLDDLGRRVIADILIGMALARRADVGQRRIFAPQQMRILPVLELGILGMGEQAERVRQQVRDRRHLLVAAGQLERRRMPRDRFVERKAPVMGEQRHHVRGDALGQRGPAEDGAARHPLLIVRRGGAIALDEADAPILHHRDREADHRRIVAQPLEPLVEPAIIDHARRLGRLGQRDRHRALMMRRHLRGPVRAPAGDPGPGDENDGESGDEEKREALQRSVSGRSVWSPSGRRSAPARRA